MTKREYALELVKKIVADAGVAEMVIERLEEEGMLHLGYGDKDIDTIINTFSECYGTTSTSRYDRYAAQRLGKRYGAQAVTGIIKALVSKQTEAYAPVVNNISELEKKWVSVLAFLRKQSDESEVLDV